MNTTRLPTAFILCCLCAAASAADNSIMTKGQKVYESNCIACHGKKGEGRGTAFPPLFRSDYIMNKPHVLLHSMVKGINGTIKVKSTAKPTTDSCPQPPSAMRTLPPSPLIS